MRWPDLSYLTWRVLGRHLAVFRRTWVVNLSFNFAEPVLYLTALGLGLGAYVRPIAGMSYLQYLGPGLIASSSMLSTAYECTYGAFVRLEYQKVYQAILATPVSLDDLVMGDILFGALKGILYGTVILIVLLVLGLVTSPWALLVPPVLAVAGMLFASLSLIWTGLFPNIESFNYFFSLIMTPLFLFSGVFFPLDGLPPFLRELAWFSPLTHVVNLTRGLVLGRLGGLPGDFLWLVVVSVVLLPLPLRLMRRLVLK
ncbi:MAG TPA: ABC transporter permease [Spirochaetia bacterium]|nr:ABC transporter permease [Spirochaetia bacterium]